MSNRRRPLLEVEPDRVDGRGRGLLVLGGDEGDRLPLVAHVVLGEQRLVGRDPERGQVAVLEQRHVRPGDHRVTPDIASAFETSSPLISALWTGERSAFAQSIPGTRTSSTYSVRPVTCSMPS